MKVEHISESRVKQIAREENKATQNRLDKFFYHINNQIHAIESEVMYLKNKIDNLEIDILKENERRKFQDGKIIDGPSSEERTW